MQDTGHHRRRLERRLRESSELRAEFQRCERELVEADRVREWLEDSSTWESVVTVESPVDALAAERDRRDA